MIFGPYKKPSFTFTMFFDGCNHYISHYRVAIDGVSIAPITPALYLKNTGRFGLRDCGWRHSYSSTVFFNLKEAMKDQDNYLRSKGHYLCETEEEFITLSLII